MRLVTDVTDSDPSRKGEQEGEPLATPDDLAIAGGRGQFILRVSEGTGWPHFAYAPGRSIAAGKMAWSTFVRNNPPEELGGLIEVMRSHPQFGSQVPADEDHHVRRLDDLPPILHVP